MVECSAFLFVISCISACTNIKTYFKSYQLQLTLWIVIIFFIAQLDILLCGGVELSVEGFFFGQHGKLGKFPQVEMNHGDLQ